MADTLKSSATDLTRPGIIEASAGTGKTFTIAEIYLALLRGEKQLPAQENFFPEDEKFSAPRVRDILVVTFTDAATAELRARLRKKIREAISENESNGKIRAALRLADAEFDEAAVFTIHGFCLRVLKEFGLSSRTDEIRASVADELSRFAARWRARKIAAGETVFFSVETQDICKVLNPLLQNPDIVPVPPDAADAHGNALFRAATEARAEWLAQRRSARDIAYGEILIELRDALRRDSTLAARIAARFRVAVVDEFQDTDPVQWEIFRRIFLEQRKPIFCVGDPKQAIYEFRGGDVRTYRKARAEIAAAGNGNVRTLGENWRSEPAVIAAFNEIFAFDQKISGTLNLGTLKKPREVSAEISGLLDYSPVAFPQKKIDALGAENFAAQEKIPAAFLKITDAASNKDTAKETVCAHIVADVAELVKHRGVPARAVAILVSDNKEANVYRTALSKENIPVSTTARGNVLCEAIAPRLADILRAMLEPQDSALFRRALLSPFFADTGTKILLENEASEEAENVRQAFAEAHARWTRNGFLPAFRTLAETLGFFKNLATQNSAGALATHVLHLTEILHTAEQKSALSPRALCDTFCAMLASAKPDDDAEDLQLRSDGDRDAVRVLTVHKSKGLEFEIVFVPSLWAKSLFSKKSAGDFAKACDANGGTVLIFDSGKDKSDAFLRASLETAGANAACLFYVALTRARSRIVVYHVPQVAKNAVWNSYQKQILDAAIPLGNVAEARLSHWQILSADDVLPETSFPKTPEKSGCEKENSARVISPNEAEQRFSAAEAALKKIVYAPEGVFSFSRIIKGSETEETPTVREDDENLHAPIGDVPVEIIEPKNEEVAFPRRSFSDLPAGAEFGTLAHLIFEKTDFRTRENLPRLLDSVLPRLPNWTETPPSEQAALRKKFAAMVEENLALPLFAESGFCLEQLSPADAVHEMEFHFPLKRSRNLYAELFRLFKSWGGIYAETAERHWSGHARGAETSLNLGGMMTGVIDLAFRADGKFFILDWKTNTVAARDVPADFSLPQSALREEIVKHGYALQWTIYALALRKFLRASLGENYDHTRDFGGVIYLFVRWLAPFFDFDTLTDARLDALEAVLTAN